MHDCKEKPVEKELDIFVEIKEDEQLSLRVEGPNFKIFKTYFPYAIIIAMGGYIVHMEARNVQLTNAKGGKDGNGNG